MITLFYAKYNLKYGQGQRDKIHQRIVDIVYSTLTNIS